MKKFFDSSKHPRSHGKFASSRGAQAIMNAPNSVRFGGGANMSGHPALAAEPRRTMTRGEGWQRIGSRIAALPVHYTGEKTMSRPAGSYLHLTLTNQIPKGMPVAEHQARVAKYVQMVKDSRKEILEGAEKNRPGKKHVYLKAHEPAARGVAKWRMKPDLYPEGTPAATLHRAYNHAALVHMHERGLVAHKFAMDDHLKDELKHTEPFMRYAIARLKLKADAAMPGERAPYVQAFGQPFHHRKNGAATGKVSQRLAPNKQLIKASPISAFRAVGQRAVGALDRAAAPEIGAKTAYQRIDGIATRARSAFETKAPNTASHGSYVAGRWAARNGAKLARNPLKAVKNGIAHSARLGSGFGQGISDEFGGSARTRRIAGRVGAVSGAVKIPLLAGALAAKPVMMAAHEAGFGGQKNQKSMSKLLAEAYDLAKMAPEIAARLADS